MTKELFNYQQEPRPFGMKTRRLNAVTRILLAIFAMMLFPQSTWAADKIIYYKYVSGTFVESTASSYTTLSGSDDMTDLTLNSGTYVVSGNSVTYRGGIVISGTSEVNIILCDGASLNAKSGIAVGYDATLNIYGQEKGTGQLDAKGYNFNIGIYDLYKGAAIGGYYRYDNTKNITTVSNCGKIYIHGGIITADSTSPSGSGGTNDAAGIGGWGADGTSDGPRELTVYGGKVTATGGLYGAGIGGGRNGNGGTVSIYGGEVIATGGAGDPTQKIDAAMGIGAGGVASNGAAGPNNGSLTVGSNVYVYGDDNDPNGLNKYEDYTYRFRYMKTDRTYGLTFAGTAVTASNASNINSASTGTASFYPATNTLKLNNLNTDNSIQTSMENLNILLEGSNTLGNSGGYIRYTGNGTGTLTFSASSGSTLKINNTISSPSAIDGFSTVNLNGVYLHTDNNPFKFDATNKQYVGMNGGLQSIEVTTTPYYMLWVGSVGTGFTQATDGALSDNMGNISQGSVIFTRDANNNTNTLTLNGAYIDGFIQSGLGDLTIDLKGNNTIAENGAYLTSNRKPISSDVSGALTFTTTDGTGSLKFLDSQYPAQPYSDPFDGFTVACDNDLAYNSTSSEIAVNYDLWVNGTQVNSANASNVFNKTRNNKATVSYANDTKTLTLNGESISVDASSGIKSGVDNLKVFLVGDNWIPEMNLNNPAFEGKNGTETITFQTDESNPGNFRGHADGNIFLNIKDYYDNNLTLFKSNNTGHTYLTFGISTPSWKGEGSENSPYIISDYDDLVALATFVNNDSATINMVFKLEFATGTLNCTNQAPFPSIGYSTYSGGYRIYSFDGIFKGNGSTIQGLTSPYGLFAFVRGSGVIENLTLDGCVVSGGDRESAAAGLVADMRGSKIENCIVQGCTISNGNNNNLTSLGGLVGYIHGSTIQNCTVVNSTVTQGGAFSFNAGAGGLVGRTYDGPSISGCSVENTQITAITTGNNEIYAGAIVGWREQDPKLSNNHYDYQVTVTAQKGNDPAVTKSGNVQRGLGDGDDEFENVTYNLVDGAVLTGLQTITLTANTDGTIDCLEGYYRYVENTNSTNKTVTVYALPSTQSNQGTKIKATSPLQYDTPTIAISDLKSGDKVNYLASSDPSITAPHAIWEIEMPAENVTATIAYPIDFSNGNRAFAITNPVNATKVYDGSPISITEITTKPSATSDDNTKVTLDISKNDFTITGYNKMSSGAATPLGTTAPTDAGDYQVIISGNGSNSSGTATVNFTITPKSMTDNSIGVSVSGTYAYDGSPKTPTLSVTDGGNAIAAANYTVKYQQNDNGNLTDVTEMRNAGSYKIVVTGKGNYKDDKSIDFTITVMNATPDVQVATTPAIVYDGNEKKPAVTVTVAGVQLTTDDYTVAYSDNVNAGTNTAKATVTLKRNYSGSAVKNFTIDQREVALEWSNTEFTYDGREHKPTAKVTNLAKTTDVCDVTVNGGQTNAGPSYTATAANLNNNNYTLPNPAPTTNFKINPKSMTDNSIGVSVSGTYAYDGSPKTPTLSVTDGGNAIAAANYTVKYQQNDNGNLTDVTEMRNAGSYKIVVTGKGNYKDDKSIDFTITVMNATPDVQVATTPAIVYDGNEKKPAVTVTVAGVQLTTDDYTVAYSDNVNAGTNTAKATVTLKRNYSGSAVKNFTIGQRVVTLDWTNLSFDYDGDPHVATATVSNKVGSDDCTVTVSGAETNAGNNYTATATGLSNNNYKLPATATALTTNFTINQREVTLTWSNTEFVYDGNSHKPTAKVNNLAKTTDVCNVTVTGGQTNAGDYTATASALDNTNYKLPTPNPTTTFTIKDRTATITFNAGQTYRTFYGGSETFLVPDDVLAYVITGVNGNEVTVEPVSYIPATKPVLLKSEPGAKSVKNTNDDSKFTSNKLVYASNAVTPDGKQYILYNGEFVRASNVIPADKVYLNLSGSNSPARTYVINTNNTTAIESVFDEETDGEEKWYDMQGRQINKPTKAGLYIKNGQKVVIKNK